jgi:antitoxin ParD1/3/4
LLQANANEVYHMAKSLNLSLTDELRRYVDTRASDSDVYATPSEYIRDLIRRDMREWAVVSDVAQGLRELRQGEFVKESILDILEEQ